VARFETRGGYAGANVFTASDNIDDVLKQVSKLETKVQNELIKDSRKALRDTVRSYKPLFKQATPKKTGNLRRSVKLKSRSRRGTTKVSLYWDADYAGYVNFWRESPHYRRVTSAYRSNKAKMARDIESNIVKAQADFFKRNGIKVTR